MGSLLRFLSPLLSACRLAARYGDGTKESFHEYYPDDEFGSTRRPRLRFAQRLRGVSHGATVSPYGTSSGFMVGLPGAPGGHAMNCWLKAHQRKAECNGDLRSGSAHPVEHEIPSGRLGRGRGRPRRSLRPWTPAAESRWHALHAGNAQILRKKFRVGAVAHKTCDVANKTGGRHVRNAVHLEGIRCDGSAHGGCQAGCLLFWKTDWVRPASGEPVCDHRWNGRRLSVDGVCTLPLRAQTVRSSTRVRRRVLYDASQLLHWWDVASTSVTCGTGTSHSAVLACALCVACISLRTLGIGYRAAVAIHDFAHRF